MSRYTVDAENRPGGAGAIASRTSVIAFDGSADTGEQLPGPADLLAAAFAACTLKNVERFSHMLPFRYRAASIHVEAEREEAPPRIARIRYELRLATDETPERIDLLRRNLVKYGTVYNTLAPACDISGTIVAEPAAVGGKENE
jgi:uncharacterized OsmC-like protein